MSTQKPEFNTKLAHINNAYFPMVERQLAGHSIQMDDYAKRCVLTAIGAINGVLQKEGIDWNDTALDTGNITNTLISIATLKLNPCASPREVYFQIRSVCTKFKDERGKSIWKKQIEMGIEGDGNDALLSRYGRDVKKVCQFWVVREGDGFEFPQYNGMNVTPPKWTPTGKGDVVRVVYPLVKTDDTVEYFIAERDSVIPNLIAHVNNNLMNETFGICDDRKNATDTQKKQIKTKKNEIFKKIKEIGLAALDDPELSEYISPSWTDFHSRESMLIRKMRNNIVKKIPKDFASYLAQEKYNEMDETYREVKEEVADNANKQPIDIDPGSYSKVEETPEAKKSPECQKEFEEMYKGAFPGADVPGTDAPKADQSPDESDTESNDSEEPDF